MYDRSAHKPWEGLSVAFCLWALLLLLFGYDYGVEDGPEFIAPILHMADSSLYSQDLFMQSLAQSGIHERTFFSWLLLPFHSELPTAFWVMHGVCTVLSIWGAITFFRLHQSSGILVYGWVFVLYVLLEPIELGAISIYSNHFQPATVAKMLVIWGLVGWKKGHIWRTIILSVLATLFQPFTGLLFFIAFATTFIYTEWKRWKMSYTLGLLTFVATAGLWILALWRSQLGTVSGLTPEKYRAIFYHFSLSCHFVPHEFSKKGILVYSLLMAFGVWYYYRFERRWFYFLCVLGIGYVVYIFGYYANVGIIVDSWWFRTSVWVELLGTAAVFLWMQRKYSLYLKRWENSKLSRSIWGLCLFAGIGLLGFIWFAPLDKWNWSSGYRYMLGDKTERYEVIELAQKIKGHTPKEACLAHPIALSSVKVHALRSSYVEYYRIIRRRDKLGEWYSRIGELYGIYKHEQVARNPAMVSDADRVYSSLALSELMRLKSRGVTHWVTFAGVNYPGLEVVCQTKNYLVYRL